MNVNQVDDIEYEIKSVDVVLRLLRADFSAEGALEAKLAIQKHIRHIESIRARLRRKLYAAMDEAEAAVTASEAPLDMVPAPDGSRVLCVAEPADEVQR